MEAICLGQSLLINQDLKMNYEPEDVTAITRTATFNRELRLNTSFWTRYVRRYWFRRALYLLCVITRQSSLLRLTQNVMIFMKCSIGGVKYGEVTQDKEKERIVATASQEVSSQSSSVCNDGFPCCTLVCVHVCDIVCIQELEPIDLTEWNKYADPKVIF